jgi:hypothetical protein
VPPLPLPETFDFTNFGRTFVDTYLAQGFGVLSKKETDRLIFKLLHEAGAFPEDAGCNLQQISVRLRIPVSRVRALTYEMQLQAGIVTDQWFRAKLLAAIRRTRYKVKLEHIEFGVEDPMLRAEIEGRLKQEGRFPDYGMSREILHVGLDDFSFLLAHVLSDKEQQAILKVVSSNRKEEGASEPTLFSQAMREFVLTAAKSAGDEVGRSGVTIAFDFLTGGAATITSAIKKVLGDKK